VDLLIRAHLIFILKVVDRIDQMSPMAVVICVSSFVWVLDTMVAASRNSNFPLLTHGQHLRDRVIALSVSGHNNEHFERIRTLAAFSYNV